MNKLLTISVAAYNIEKYIDKLMKSIIISESLDFIEILIINDGSVDRTLEIASSYQEKYPDSVKVINKENGGHGSTINRGIREAAGKYFRALDGDDWVNSENLKKLVNKLQNINSDIILSEYCECYEDGTELISNDFQNLEDGKNYSFDEISEKVRWMRYHTVIFRTKLLKENAIQLDEKCFYVDSEFMILPIPYVETIYFSRDYIYCYRLGLSGQSISPESRRKHIDNGLAVAKRLVENFNQIENQLSFSKRNYMIHGIVLHCTFHYDSFFMFKPNKQTYEDIISFDLYLKEHLPEVYLMMNDKRKKIKVLRETNYKTYWIIGFYKYFIEK